MLFVLNEANGAPGVYYAEAYALPYLISLFAQQDKTQGLIRPALDLLNQHDTERNSELYETLYQYLTHEGSILLGSKAMHVHKNPSGTACSESVH